MPRTKVTSTSKDAITDDGNVLLSYIDGEQLELDFTAGWLTSLSGVQIRCQVLEAVNDTSGSRPTQVQANGVRRSLEIRNSDGTAVSGRSFEPVTGASGNSITVRRDITNTHVVMENFTTALIHEHFLPGTQFKVLQADGTLSSNTYTIERGTNYGFNPDSGQAIANLQGLSSLASETQIPASSASPAEVYFEYHHQLTSTGNQFRLVLPEDLITRSTTVPGHSGGADTTVSWTQAPTPGNGVYGFIGLEIREAVSSGQVQQIWRPMRGQVEVLYSVLSSTV